MTLSSTPTRTLNPWLTPAEGVSVVQGPLPSSIDQSPAFNFRVDLTAYHPDLGFIRSPAYYNPNFLRDTFRQWQTAGLTGIALCREGFLSPLLPTN